MVELVPAICPKCGANLEVPEDLKIAHCIYCGAKVIIEESKPDVHYHGIGTLENYLELGQLMIEKGHSEKAIEYFNKALEIDAKSIEAWYGRGLADESVGKYLHALFWYNKVLKINPKHEKTLKRIEAMHRTKLNEAENKLKNLLSELKKLESDKTLTYYSFLIFIIFGLILDIVVGSFPWMTIAFPSIIFIFIIFDLLTSRTLFSYHKWIRSKQVEISKQREMVDDLKRYTPDKESFKDSFVSYFNSKN